MTQNKVKKIALTGGIGSGKSTALNLIKEQGYFTVSCDKVSAKATNKKSTLKKIKRLFPDSVKGKLILTLDKKSLSKTVFNDTEKLSELNALLHPIILDTALRTAEKKGKGVAFIEVPLLFEGGYEKSFDGVLVILRDKEKRIESVKTRSNLTEEEILARMNNQIDYETFDFKNFTVIENNGDESSLKEKIKEYLEKIK